MQHIYNSEQEKIQTFLFDRYKDEPFLKDIIRRASFLFIDHYYDDNFVPTMIFDTYYFKMDLCINNNIYYIYFNIFEAGIDISIDFIFKKSEYVISDIEINKIKKIFQCDDIVEQNGKNRELTRYKNKVRESQILNDYEDKYSIWFLR